MTDRLTQLQTAIDQFGTQCFSALRYITDHHDAISVNGEPKVPDADANVSVDPPEVFKAAQTELARDLVMKMKQVEFLTLQLPGVGQSVEDQERRLRTLEAMLKEAERERVAAVAEKERAREKLEKVLVGLRRV